MALVSGRALVDLVEKAHELFRVPLGSARAEDDTIEQTQGRIETRGPMANVIVGLAFRNARAQRQPGLMPHIPDRFLADARRPRHAARTPQCVRPGGVVVSVDDGGHPLRREALRTSGSGRVPHHTADASRDVTADPVVDMVPADRQPRGDMGRPHVVGEQQHESRTDRQLLWRGPFGCQCAELRAIGRRQYDAELGHEHAPTVTEAHRRSTVKSCTNHSYARD